MVAADSSDDNPPERGTIVAEALRSLDLDLATTTGQICLGEEPVTTSPFPELLPLCICPDGAPRPQYADNAFGPFSIRTVCSAGPQLTAAVESYRSKAIGRWTNPFLYPGPERLRINFAEYTHTDLCDQETRLEPFYGVTTLEGWATFTLTGTGSGTLTPVPNTFIDQSNPLTFNQKPTQNIRYWSDKVLNVILDPGP